MKSKRKIGQHESSSLRIVEELESADVYMANLRNVLVLFSQP
jgi:hypothetical protein